MPKAEILLAAFNGETYVAEQLDSLLAQSWPDFHITVSDDASTDRTPEILATYAARYPEKITVLQHGLHFGNARDHFFYLMKQCQEEHMLFCDQDDVWNPDKTEITMRAMLAEERKCTSETPVLVFTDAAPVDAALRPLAASLMKLQKQDISVVDYRKLLIQNVVTGCTMGINRALAQQAVRCQTPQDVIMHDWWLGAVAARFGKVIYVDQPTMLYRQHGKNEVGAKDVRSLQYIVSRARKPAALRQLILAKKKQAACFAQTYQAQLNAADERFLHSYIRPHSGLVFYIRHRHLFCGFLRFVGFLVLG